MTSSPTALASSAFPATLPPVRQLRQMPLPLMASVSEDPISLWLKLGAIEKLEQVVLDGHGDQLHGKSSRIPQVNKFLRQVPAFQNKIDEIHRAVAQGKLRKIQHLIDRKKLAFCRDQMGASTLHKAVMFKQKEVIQYLTSHYGSIIHTRDHQGRTPLHYAAVLQDDGEIYNFLLEAGADKKATDMHGHTPEYYLKSQDELTLQDLKQGAKRKIRRGRHRTTMKGPESAQSKLHNKNKQLIHEMVMKGNLENLENLVLKGQGDKLLDESSSNPLVEDFLNMVPVYMERIQAIHGAVVRGRLRDVQSLMDRKSLALARDATGATPLHKAVIYGHQDVAKYIAQNFPLSRDVKDSEGNTALHYAAVLKDNQEMYNMLVAAGARTSILDSKEKLPEYYLEHGDEINLNQILKRNRRLNTSYASKIASKVRRRLQSIEGYQHPAGKMEDSPENLEQERQEPLEEHYEDMESGTSGAEGHSPLYKRGILLREKPLPPASTLDPQEVTSANIRKWITEEDIEKLEGAIIEGYGEKILEQDVNNKEDIQNYLSSSVPEMLAKIKAIHTAISNDDLVELEGHLDKNDLALAKDHTGMTPLHRAVLLGRMNVLQYLVDKFPETINAKDKEGRTALHYAAAVVRRSGGKSYNFLLEAGGDIRARDNQGRSADYYLNHNVAIPNLSEIKVRPTQKKNRPDVPHAAHNRVTVVAASGMSERITNCLQKGDLEQLKEIVLEGKGKHLVGRTSWNEETRQFLRALPTNLARIDSLHNAVRAGDVEAAKVLLNEDITLIRARDEFGNTPVHLSIIKNQPEMLQYLINNFPTVLNLKDKNGRTALHRAAQEKNEELYKILIEAGADPMILDQKGRTADYYLNGPLRHDPATKPIKQLSESDSGTENQSSIEKEDFEVDVDDTAENNDTLISSTQELATQEPIDHNDQKDNSVNHEELPNNTQKEEEKEEVIPANDITKEQGMLETLEKKFVEQQEDEKQETENNKEKTEDTNEKEITDQSISKDKESSDADNADSVTSPSMASSTGKASTWDRLNELIDYWIKERDLLRLEHVVIAGQGQRLIGRTSDDKQVQEFLDLVPTYMARISAVHEAVVRGNLAEVKAVLTRKRFALSRDHLGASPLHLAVLHGHTDILRYIINHFPETLDGPDNEGRTPLHYAAIMRDGGHYYKILKNALADEEIIDKNGHTAEYYLRHPGEVTIRDLLEGYKVNIDSKAKPTTVNIWQRPPTDEIEKRLTPPSREEALIDCKDVAQQQHIKTNNSSGATANYFDKNEQGQNIKPNDSLNKEEDEKTILFDRKTEDGKYLATALGDVLVKALTEVSQKRPPDPIGYLAAWLYNYASQTPRAKLKSPVTGDHEESLVGSGSTEFGEDRDRGSADFHTIPLDVLNTVAAHDVCGEEPLLFENHTKMKDEEGQTVLHFAASRRHPNGSFYVLVSQAELLLAERDSKYRTARDVAVEAGMADNVATLDRYVLDAFLSQKSTLLQMLAHDGYNYLLNVTDSDGRDLTSTLKRQEGSEAIVALVQELSDFQKNREELHTFVRHDYMEGVSKLIKRDSHLISSKNDRGRCSVHIAVVFGNTELIKALVDANSSSVHVPDNLGRTPLHYAMAMPNIEQIGKILIRAGAQRTVRDVKMRTPSYFFIYKDEILSIQGEEKQLV